MIQKGLRSQIAFFFLYFGQTTNNHHSTAQLRHPHRNNDAILLTRAHRNNASILHHSPASYRRHLTPPADPRLDFFFFLPLHATPKGRQNRRPRLLRLREHGRPHVCNAGSDRTRLLFARPMGEGGPAHRAPASGTLSVREKRGGGGAWKERRGLLEEKPACVWELRRWLLFGGCWRRPSREAGVGRVSFVFGGLVERTIVPLVGAATGFS